MLGNKEKDKIVKRYGDYYWEQIKKLSESYDKDIEERAREIEEKDKRIGELEQELAELKEKAIVPKFKIGQEVWYVGCSSIQSWIVNKIELDYMENDKLCEIYRLGHYGTDDYFCCIMPFDSDRYFATEQEAQDKLKEIQGNG